MKFLLMQTSLALVAVFSFVMVFGQAVKHPSSFTVAQDGSGNFKTIQEAINAVRDLSQQQVTIHIKKGTYREKLVIPSWKTNVSLVGEDRENTVISWNDHTGKPYPGGKDPFGKDKFTTYTSYTLLIQGNDCRVENLTVENTSGRVGQGVALHVESDRIIVKNCKLLGNQDTLYTATSGSRQYYRDCFIEGTTDFIFGEATAVFENCTLKNLTNSYITAASTRPSQKFGYVFLRCKLVADTAATKVFLGRPWRPSAKTVFIQTEMGGHILPVGWHNWGNPENEKTVLYAEFNNSGPGAGINDRAKWSKQLSAREARQYTLHNIFAGDEPWVPAN